MSIIVACFVTMLVTAFFFSAVSLTKIKESDAEAAKWKALADYEAAEKHRALNDLNAERIKKEIDKPTEEQVRNAYHASRSTDTHCDGPEFDCDQCPVRDTCDEQTCAAPQARAWLASHGLPVEEPEEAKA